MASDNSSKPKSLSSEEKTEIKQRLLETIEEIRATRKTIKSRELERIRKKLEEVTERL